MVNETRIDGRGISYRREQGESPTLVCMHGAGGNRHAYDRLVDALPGIGCVVVDRPGRLGSEGPPDPGFAEQATFMRSFIASEVPGDHVLVGHSLGGALALELAIDRPVAGLKGVVLLATGARLKVHPTILALFEQLASSGAPVTLTPGLIEPNAAPAMVREMEQYLAATPSPTALVDWRSTNTFDRMADLGRISVPTLIVAGSADALTPPKYAEYMHAQIPSSELHVIDDAHHMFLMERAPVVADLVRGFVERL